MQLAFGAGALWGNRTDVTGGGIGPDQFGILQDVQIDFDWTTKELWGQFQFPVDIARGQGKISGKAKLVLTNQFMGYTPTFKATFYTTKTTGGAASGLALVLNACTASKLSLPTKTDDYEIQEFDFSAFADPTGTIGTLSSAE